MEIRSATISYAKYKVKASYLREKEIERQFDHLGSIICNIFFSADIDSVLQKYENLKTGYVSVKVSLYREWRASNKIFFES